MSASIPFLVFIKLTFFDFMVIPVYIIPIYISFLGEFHTLIVSLQGEHQGFLGGNVGQGNGDGGESLFKKKKKDYIGIH